MNSSTVKLKDKNYSIESLRFIAALAVICIHFFYPKNKELTLWINQWARFAVPFFFMVSGYFLAQKLQKNDKPSVYFKYIKKVLILYIVWQVIYFMNPPIGDIYIYGIKKAYLVKWNGFIHQRWDLIVFKGFAQHLWFFASLSLTVLYFLIFRLKRVYLMLGFSILLYLVGALTKAYVKTSIGIDPRFLGFPDKFNTNNLIFFSALPFTVGVLFSLKNWKVNIGVAFLVLIIGYGLHAAEVWWLGTQKLHQRVDYVFSTILVGLGVFMIGLARFKPLEWKPLASLGKYSLGIYGMHVLVSVWIYTTFQKLLNEEEMTQLLSYKHIILTVGTLIVSTGITYILSKIPILKNIV